MADNSMFPWLQSAPTVADYNFAKNKILGVHRDVLARMKADPSLASVEEEVDLGYKWVTYSAQRQGDNIGVRVINHYTRSTT